MDTDLTFEQPPDILDAPSAGHQVIRGTAARTAGHFVGLGLLLIAAPLLTRHLGVTDYGSYVVVGSLITIAMIFADGGLGTAAVTEYAVRDTSGRRSLMVVGIQFVSLGLISELITSQHEERISEQERTERM